MKAGIVGLPNVGKSTLFNCLSNAKAQSANFPFCTIEPNIGVINVPDLRLEKLESLVKPESVVPATVEIVDIAGLVRGASKGEGLGNKFLSNISQTDAIIHVLRCFENDKIVHVDSSVNPVRDKETIDIELQLKDLEVTEKRIEKIKKIANTGNIKAQKELGILYRIKKALLSSVSIRNLEFSKDEADIVNSLQYITNKPVLYLCNVDQGSVVKGNAHVNNVIDSVKDEGAQVLMLAAEIESDIAELETYLERKMFLEDLGIDEPGASKLIRAVYKLLNLQTYFTAGAKEVRAWTIHIGDTAPKAARVIHTDFEKGFIRVEVIKYDDFVKFGSEVNVKKAGKLAVEGKDYVVEDGDMLNFRFNI